MGQAVRGTVGSGGEWRGAVARAVVRGRWIALRLALGLSLSSAPLSAQPDVARRGPERDAVADIIDAQSESPVERIKSGRFMVFFFNRDRTLATSVLRAALSTDSFPGLRRPTASVTIAIAPDAAIFRSWAGPSAPDWGAAVAFPSLQRIVMQGSRGGSDAGNPLVTLRHELAHLALAEALGDLPPRWFDEGYASVSALEWSREEALATNVGLALRGVPSLEGLELLFYRGASDAKLAYALAHRAVAELQSLDGEAGLSRFFAAWGRSNSFEIALRESYGLSGAAFEKRWQQQTRRRYGALALLTNLSLGFGILAIVIAPFVWRRRRRDRERLEALRRADSAQEAAQRASVLAALLAVEGSIRDASADLSVDSVSRRS